MRFLLLVLLLIAPCAASAQEYNRPNVPSNVQVDTHHRERQYANSQNLDTCQPDGTCLYGGAACTASTSDRACSPPLDWYVFQASRGIHFSPQGGVFGACNATDSATENDYCESDVDCGTGACADSVLGSSQSYHPYSQNEKEPTYFPLLTEFQTRYAALTGKSGDLAPYVALALRFENLRSDTAWCGESDGGSNTCPNGIEHDAAPFDTPWSDDFIKKVPTADYLTMFDPTTGRMRQGVGLWSTVDEPWVYAIEDGWAGGDSCCHDHPTPGNHEFDTTSNSTTCTGAEGYSCAVRYGNTVTDVDGDWTTTDDMYLGSSGLYADLENSDYQDWNAERWLYYVQEHVDAGIGVDGMDLHFAFKPGWNKWISASDLASSTRVCAGLGGSNQWDGGIVTDQPTLTTANALFCSNKVGDGKTHVGAAYCTDADDCNFGTCDIGGTDACTGDAGIACTDNDICWEAGVTSCRNDCIDGPMYQWYGEKEWEVAAGESLLKICIALDVGLDGIDGNSDDRDGVTISLADAPQTNGYPAEYVPLGVRSYRYDDGSFCYSGHRTKGLFHEYTPDSHPYPGY